MNILLRATQTMKHAILLVLMIFLSCQKQPAVFKAKHTFYRMDTVVEVTLVIKGKEDKDNKKRVAETWQTIDSLLEDFEVRFSQTHPGSEVLAINNKKDTTRVISATLTEMLAVGLGYGDSLDGMFDLTILPIKELWGFGEKDQQKEVVPEHDAITQALEWVDYRNVTVNTKKRTIHFLNEDVIVDVGGIAKGFSLREMGKLLDALGHSDYLIVAGGDIIGKGRRPDGNPWKVGIKHPRNDRGMLGAFRLDSGSVVTSGDYERYWIKEGKRYHHIFNPNTGYSCTENQSLTIWCMDPIIADVLSTGMFCSPRDEILAFVEARPHLECVIVDSGGTVVISSGWKDKVQIF